MRHIRNPLHLFRDELEAVVPRGQESCPSALVHHLPHDVGRNRLPPNNFLICQTGVWTYVFNNYNGLLILLLKFGDGLRTAGEFR